MTQNNTTNNPGKPELDESIPVVGIHKAKGDEYTNGFKIYFFNEPNVLDKLGNHNKVRLIDTMRM